MVQENKRASECVIRDFNSIIKMTTSKHRNNVLIIITEYMTLIYDMLTIKNNEYLNLEIEIVENSYKLL